MRLNGTYQANPMASHPGAMGGSDFESVLNRVAAAAGEDSDDVRTATVAPGFWRVIGELAGRSSSPGARRAYVGEGLEPAPAAEPSAPLPSLDRHDIAAELGIRPHLSAAQLKRLRRLFAAGNHPDRVAPDLRERATLRMTLANTLIDDAIAGRI